MAHAARPLGSGAPERGPATSRHWPWPWPAPAPPPTPPAARRPDAPRRAAQDKTRTTNVDGSISTNTTHWQSKQSTHKEAHGANEAISRAKGILRPDSSEKHRMPRSSGGRYSKPDPRVKLIPAEEITYVQHRKLYCRHVGPAGLEKRNCRQSITPPPNSRKVSLVVSPSIVQKPACNPCLSPKKLKSAENGHSCVGEYVTSSVAHPSSTTHQNTSLKNPVPSSSKASQPSNSSLNTDSFGRNLGRMDGYYDSGIFHSQGQSRKQPTAGLPKEAATNPVSPCPKPGSSEDHLGKMAESSSKNARTSENVKLHNGSCNLDARSAATPVFQAPIVQPRLLSPTSVLGGISPQVYPDRVRTASPILQKPIVKNVLPIPTSLLSERSTEVHQSSKPASPQSTTPTQSKEFSKERDMGQSINCDISSEFRHKGVQEIGVTTKNVFPSQISLPSERSSDLYPSNPQSTSPAQCNELSKETNPVPSITYDTTSGVQETGAPVILHTKLHKKHYQSEARWKGNFHVTGELRHNCDGLEAHFPFEISIKVYEASKQMPEILKLEAVPLTQVWPKKFKIKPPDGQDVGLCFTSSHQRPHRSFDLLLGKTSHVGLWTNLGDAELSIFSSKLLAPDYQRKDGKLYFWGVFGKRLRKKHGQPNYHIKSVEISNPSQPSEDSCEMPEEIDMKLDMAEGKETEGNKSENGMALGARGSEERERGKSEDIGNTVNVTGDKVVVRDEEIASVLDLSGGNQTVRVNECAAVLRTSDSNPASSFAAPAASFLDGSCSLDSSNSPCQADSVLVLDRPPGFSDVSASVLFDALPGFCTVIPPPGFTKAHRRVRTITSSKFDISVTETKPLVDSSLNVSRPVGMEELSGFTTLLAVKKEPGSSAVGKGTENQMPSSLASGEDNPTGFATDVSPSFTEAHCQIPTITNAESETGASTPVTEKKSLISFSLNIPRLLRTEALPGFTTALAVRKEPGSFAIDKVIDKQTPSSFPSGASSIRTDGKVGATKISHYEVQVTVEPESSDEREFPRSRLLSDILGLSPSSLDDTASNTPTSTPRICTEVCRAVSARLPDKHQRMEEPGTQVHQRKRGPQEPPGDTTTKRPNVNGRIALNSAQVMR